MPVTSHTYIVFTLTTKRVGQIIRYSNTADGLVIFIFVLYFHTEYYSYSYLDDFSKPNTIRIHIGMIFQTRVAFVFVFGGSSKIEMKINHPS